MKYSIGERYTCIAQPISLINSLQRMLGRFGSMDEVVLSVDIFLDKEDELCVWYPEPDVEIKVWCSSVGSFGSRCFRWLGYVCG